MKVTVRLYGHLAWFGIDRGGRLEVDLPGGSTVSDLTFKLRIPDTDVKLIAVNGRQCPDSHRLSDGDRVEYIPVIVGG